jgi:hypothetical protein
MKNHEGQKTNQPDNAIFHTACILMLSFLMLCGTGYASSDTPVSVNMAPAAIGVAADLVGESGLNNPANITVVMAAIGNTDASGYESAFNDEQAGNTEEPQYAGTASRTKQSTRSACTESCSL